MPLIALGGIGMPALQALATRQVNDDRQGQLQGVLASTFSLASIVAPLAFSSLYFALRTWWPGAIWLSVVVLYAFAVPLIYRCTRREA
ncbi:Tetracycline resistance protein, class C [Raoultella terrigena]|uniref:Tetracycline resistance protein, class C n=1 Tax=Raoultella terrigena TaxID=577 RepID=A0A3P8KT24_RAOTE|nr:Tetracycline resistance protein, class C [Raoultella terrigena]